MPADRKKRHTHEGYCSLCDAVVEVERVYVLGPRSGKAWRCLHEQHLAVAPSTVRVVHE